MPPLLPLRKNPDRSETKRTLSLLKLVLGMPLFLGAIMQSLVQ